MGRRTRRRLAAVLGAGLVLGFLSCGGEPSAPDLILLSGATMGTSWMVKIPVDATTSAPSSLQVAIESELDQVNAEMSHYREESEISRFNRTPSTGWYVVSAPFAAVVTEALDIGRASEGRLDVTLGPLIDLWGFGAKGDIATPPSDDALTSTRARVGLDHLEVRKDPPALRKDIPDLELNLSAIAKGHGVDRIAALLSGEGIGSYFIEIGGEIFARGEKSPGQPWRVGIEEPLTSRRAVHSVVPLRDGGMATSGDYRSFWRDQGRTFSHTLDPRTGRPVTHDLASVTVIAETCARADGWATALLVAGAEACYTLAEREGLAAFLIIRTPTGFETRATPAFLRATEPDR